MKTRKHAGFRTLLYKAVSVASFWKWRGCKGGFSEEMERGCYQVSGGEGDPDLSRDIPRGTVVHGDPRWNTGGVRRKEWHREVAAHWPRPLALSFLSLKELRVTTGCDTKRKERSLLWCSAKYVPSSDLNNPLSILVWVLKINNSRSSSLEEKNLNHKVSKPHLNMGIMFMWMRVPFQKITLHVSWSK